MKIKLLTISSVIVATAMPCITLSSCSKTYINIITPSEQQTTGTTSVGETSVVYSLTLKEEATEGEISVTLSNITKKTSNVLCAATNAELTVTKVEVDGKNLQFTVNCNDSHTSETTYSFTTTVKSTKGWTEEIPNCKFVSSAWDPVLVTGVTINASNQEVAVNNELTLGVTIAPSNATNKNVTWSSSNTEVATIDETGKLTAKANGTTTITATAQDESSISSSVEITVYTQLVEKVTVYDATTAVGQKTAIYAAVSPANASYPTLKYTTANTNIATIDQEGYITGVAEGSTTATVSATDGSGKSATAKVTVTKNIVYVTSISIPSVSSLGLEEKVQLNPTVSPSNATNKSLTWSTSNSAIATVDTNGLVTGHAVGSATITATARDGSGKTGSITIKVVDKSIPVETWKEYIFNRTFSLLGWGDNYVCWGTGWIISDATPANSSDYSYYIATNMHVQKGIEEVGAYPQYVYFGCNEKSSGLDLDSDYVPFGSGNFTKIADSNFTLDNSSTISYQGTTGKKGIDLSVAKVNFANVTGSSTSPSKTIAKNKLDILNKFTAAGQPITQFAPTTNNSTHYENIQLYTGGYPVKNNEYATWEYHDVSSELDLDYWSNSEIETYNYWHTTDDYSSVPIADCSPQYIDDKGVSTTWMDGGASGSMLLGNFGTSSSPTWKICGIYWGGFSNSAETVFYPAYDIFKSSWKDYISTYLTI